MPQRSLFSLCVADPAVTLGRFLGFFNLLGLACTVVKRVKLKKKRERERELNYLYHPLPFSRQQNTQEAFYKYLWYLVFRKRTKVGNINEIIGPLQKVLSNARGEGIIA